MTTFISRQTPVNRLGMRMVYRTNAPEFEDDPRLVEVILLLNDMKRLGPRREILARIDRLLHEVFGQVRWRLLDTRYVIQFMAFKGGVYFGRIDAEAWRIDIISVTDTPTFIDL